METNGVKRLPVMRGDKIVGIVSRANLLQAVASLVREIPDPTADDDHIRSRIIAAIEKNDWSPFGLNVIVRDGIVHLSGVITEERSRQAAMVAAENVAGVKKVHDHLCWVDTMSGLYLESPEDVEHGKSRLCALQKAHAPDPAVVPGMPARTVGQRTHDISPRAIMPTSRSATNMRHCSGKRTRQLRCRLDAQRPESELPCDAAIT
jgi:hypothetical protein